MARGAGGAGHLRARFCAVPRLAELGAAPERVRWSERGNPRFFVSWWRVPGCSLAGGQFAVAYCVPSVIVCAIALVYVFRFPGVAPFLAFVLPFHLGNF